MSHVSSLRRSMILCFSTISTLAVALSTQNPALFRKSQVRHSSDELTSMNYFYAAI